MEKLDPVMKKRPKTLSSLEKAYEHLRRHYRRGGNCPPRWRRFLDSAQPQRTERLRGGAPGVSPKTPALTGENGRIDKFAAHIEDLTGPDIRSQDPAQHRAPTGQQDLETTFRELPGQASEKLNHPSRRPGRPQRHKPHLEQASDSRESQPLAPDLALDQGFTTTTTSLPPRSQIRPVSTRHP